MEHLLVAALTIIATLVYAIYSKLNKLNYWKIRDLPYLKVNPLIGYMSPVYLRQRPFPMHSKFLYQTNPELRYYGTFDFNTPVIIVKDPDLVREICVKNFDSFPDHRPFVSEDMDPVLGRNVFSLSGKRWKEVRNTLSPSFTTNKLKIMFQLISKCSKNFVDHLEGDATLTECFDAKDAFTRYTNDVIATTAFGIEVNSMKDPENEFYRNGREAVDFSSPLKILKFFLFRISPKLTRLFGGKFLTGSTDRFFNRLIAETVKAREDGSITRPDMIHLMMQAKNKESGIGITNDDIIGQAFIFFVAGFDTSSTLMCFVALELALHPDIQDKVHKEIDEQLRQESGEVTYESVSRMKYLDMVMNEALRRHPPTPLTDRVCIKDTVIPGAREGDPSFRVEKGVNIVLPIYGLLHDPKYFPEPDKFIPERFDEGSKDSINPYAYIPFGVGPRKCIGYRFALMEAKILLVHILNKFRIELTDQSPRTINYSTTAFNMQIEGGFWIKLAKR